MKKSVTKLTTAAVVLFASFSASASHITPQEATLAGIDIIKVKEVAAKYPASELMKRREGNVVLSYDICNEGKPENIAVVSRTGSKEFVRSAIKALKKSRFQPVTSGDETLRVVGMQKEFTFAYDHSIDYRSTLELVALNPESH